MSREKGKRDAMTSCCYGNRWKNLYLLVLTMGRLNLMEAPGTGTGCVEGPKLMIHSI